MTELAVPDGVDPDDPASSKTRSRASGSGFHTRPADPDTDPLELDLWASPEMSPLAEHVHPQQDETFTVHAGRVEVSRDGEASRYGEGSEVTITAGTPHAWANAGDYRLHMTVRFQPGLQTEAFLRDLAILAQRDAVRADGAPSLLRVAALYDAYGYDLLHLASPPLRIQKVLFGALAPVAMALGYRADPVEEMTEHPQ